MSKKKFMMALLAGAMLVLPAAAQASRSGAWTGVDFGPDATTVYVGGVTALSGQDIHTQDGWLARADGSWGDYDYDTVLAGPVNASIDGDVWQGDLLVGYRHNFTGGSLTGYLGGEIQRHDLSPDDPGNDVDGSEGGVKGLVELGFSPGNNIDAGVSGSYSSSFNSYRIYGTAGYDFGPVTIGPEVTYQGNEDWHQFRFGAAVTGIDLGFVEVSGHVGAANNTDRGDDGAYGGVGLSKNF